MRRSVIESLISNGIEPDDLIQFLKDSHQEARILQDAKKQYQTINEQLREDIRLTRIEYLIVLLQKESIKLS